jgi:hypothetical protein
MNINRLFSQPKLWHSTRGSDAAQNDITNGVPCRIFGMWCVPFGTSTFRIYNNTTAAGGDGEEINGTADYAWFRSFGEGGLLFDVGLSMDWIGTINLAAVGTVVYLPDP